MSPRDEGRAITYSAHAEERLVRRGVSKADVERVIRTGAWKQDSLNTFVAHIQVGGRPPLQVVFAEEDDRLHVITVKNREW